MNDAPSSASAPAGGPGQPASTRRAVSSRNAQAQQPASGAPVAAPNLSASKGPPPPSKPESEKLSAVTLPSSPDDKRAAIPQPTTKHFGMSLRIARPSWNDGLAPSDPEPVDPLKRRLWAERQKYLSVYDDGEAALSALLAKVNKRTARGHKRTYVAQSQVDKAEARKYADAMRAIRQACVARGLTPDRLTEIATLIERDGAAVLMRGGPECADAQTVSSARAQGS